MVRVIRFDFVASEPGVYERGVFYEDPLEVTMEELDIEQVVRYLNTAEGMKGRNEFAHGWNLGRAMEYVEQNAMDYDWFIDELRGRGLDTGIVPVPKIEADRG